MFKQNNAPPFIERLFISRNDRNATVSVFWRKDTKRQRYSSILSPTGWRKK